MAIKSTNCMKWTNYLKKNNKAPDQLQRMVKILVFTCLRPPCRKIIISKDMEALNKMDIYYWSKKN